MSRIIIGIVCILFSLTSIDLPAQDANGSDCPFSEYIIDGKETPVDDWCEMDHEADKVYVVVSDRSRMPSMAQRMLSMQAARDFGQKIATVNGEISNSFSAYLNEEGQAVSSATSSRFETTIPQPRPEAFKCVQEGPSSMCYGLYSLPKQAIIDNYEASMSNDAEKYVEFQQFKNTEAYKELIDNL